MKHVLTTVAAGAAMTLASLAPAQAQQSPPGSMPPSAAQPNQGTIAVQSLGQQRIRQLQQALKDRGLYQGQIDGRWGPETAQALRQFKGQQPGMSDRTQQQSGDRIDSSTLTALGVNVPPTGQRPLDRTSPGSPSSPPSTAPGAPPSGSPQSPGTNPGMRQDNRSPGMTPGGTPDSSPGRSPGSSPGTSPGSSPGGSPGGSSPGG